MPLQSRSVTRPAFSVTTCTTQDNTLRVASLALDISRSMQRGRGSQGMLEIDAAAILHDMVGEATTLLELTASQDEDGSQPLRVGDDIYFSRRDYFEQTGSHLYHDKSTGQYRFFDYFRAS